MRFFFFFFAFSLKSIFADRNTDRQPIIKSNMYLFAVHIFSFLLSCQMNLSTHNITIKKLKYTKSNYDCDFSAHSKLNY